MKKDKYGRSQITLKKKVLSFIFIMVMLFSLTACGGGAATKKTTEHSLNDSYWYADLGSIYSNKNATAYIKFEFDSNGTCNGTMISKDYSEPGYGTWEYEQNDRKLKVVIGALNLEFIYDESGKYFELKTLGEESYPDDYKKIILFPCDRSFDILDEEAYVYLKTKECGEGDYRTEYSNIIDPFEESRLLRDKMKLDELRVGIMLACVEDYDDYEDIQANPNPVRVDPEKGIIISELFDTSNANGKKFVEFIEDHLDAEEIILYSKLKDDCTIQIIDFDPFGRVVIQVISESNDIRFYLDDGGEHDGIYEG